MGRRFGYGRMTTAWRLHSIGGPDLALRYLQMSEQKRTERAFPEPAPLPEPRRSVVINDVRVSDEDVERLEQAVSRKINDGFYWYDTISGAWGPKGGPCAGFILSGLSLGGPLRKDASRGDTGVFFNGRELHALDLIALRRLAPVLPGRYWADSGGNYGIEGGPRMGNINAGGRFAGGAAWTLDTQFGSIGSAGAGFLFFNDNKPSWSA